MSVNTLTVTGYHGTLADRADRIEKEGFRQSRKPIEWLGFGVYFFDNRRNAERWARQEFRRCSVKVHPPVILIVDITTAQDGLLDLDRPDVMSAFEGELKRLYRDMFSDAGKGAPRFKTEQETRCFWCNCYKKAHPELQVIAFTFPHQYVGRFGFPNIQLQRQLCVVEDCCIGMPPKKVEVKS